MCMLLHQSMVMCMCVQYPRSPEEGTGSPGAGVTGGWELSMWVLGTELRSSVRTARPLNCGSISAALIFSFLRNLQLTSKVVGVVFISVGVDHGHHAHWGEKASQCSFEFLLL